MADGTGRRLGLVQLSGHRAIDAIYAPLSREVEALILRYAVEDERGIPRLSRAIMPLILQSLGTLLDRVRLDLTHTIMRAVRAAAAVAEASAPLIPREERPDPIAPTLEDMETSGLVYRSLATDRPSVLGQTASILVRGIAAGLAAREIAKQARQYFSPLFAPRRSETGKLLRADRLGAINDWPGKAGMASQHARTVMLTETTGAHSRMQQRIAIYGDQLMRYTVSPQHSKADECDALAHADSGFGPGVYEPRDAPRIPRHPRCRCHYQRVERRREEAA